MVTLRGMRLLSTLLGKTTFLSVLALAVCLPATASHVRRQATAGHTHHHRHPKTRHKLHGQTVIDSQRATEIQQALIHEHYLSGDATGTWDAQSQAAMQKFQADNGWQTKITPDSRALIKLGLGPKRDEGEYTASNQALPSATSDLTVPAPMATSPAAATDTADFSLNSGKRN